MKNADEDEVLRLMPPPMRRSTIKFVYSDLVSKMLLFKGLNEAVTMEMLVALRMPRHTRAERLAVLLGQLSGRLYCATIGPKQSRSCRLRWLVNVASRLTSELWNHSGLCRSCAAAIDGQPI